MFKKIYINIYLAGVEFGTTQKEDVIKAERNRFLHPDIVAPTSTSAIVD